MIGFVTTKKSISTVLLVVFLSFILLALVVFKANQTASAEVLERNALDTKSRIIFLKNLGYETEGSEEKKQIEIPYIFSNVYKTYQDIQKLAGYNLEKFAGKPATLYTYHLKYPTRNDVYAHLIVYKDSVIGGDISALSVEDGFMRPLLAEFGENEDGTTG